MERGHDHISHYASERPAFPVFGPAIFRHLVFRIPDHENPRWPNDYDWSMFCTPLTSFVNKARRHFGSEPNIVLVRGKADATANQKSINSTVLVSLSPEGAPISASRPECRVRLRIDVHTEVYAITLSVDSFGEDCDHRVTQKLRALPSNAELLTALFDEVWSDSNGPFGAMMRDLEGEPLFGERVADFRGIALLADQVDPKTDCKALQFKVAAEPPLSPNLALYFNEHQELFRKAIGITGESANRGEQASESVLCSMLDGHALYAAPLVHWGAGVQPVRYLVVYGGNSPDQLGRLIRRLHVMGELRHVALLDYDRGPNQPDLKRASKDMREIGIEFDTLIGSEQLNFAALKKIGRSVNDLNRHADGGIGYRVEQSLYYSSAFKERLPDLRVGRIEGYQPYDAFVRRYIYQTFSKIAQVGRRFEMLGRRVDRWTFLSNAENAEKFQIELGHTTKEMNQVVTSIGKLQLLSERLLTNAERFATVFLVYYVGSVLEKAFSESSKEIQFAYNCVWTAAVVVVVFDVAGNDSKLSKMLYTTIRRFSAFIFRRITWVGKALRQSAAAIVGNQNEPPAPEI